MRRDRFDKAGRLHHIIYDRCRAISVGEKGYARIEVKLTEATRRRLERLVAWRFGSPADPATNSGGVIYRSSWAYLMAVWRAQVFVWQAKRKAKKAREGRG